MLKIKPNISGSYLGSMWYSYTTMLAAPSGSDSHGTVELGLNSVHASLKLPFLPNITLPCVHKGEHLETSRTRTRASHPASAILKLLPLPDPSCTTPTQSSLKVASVQNMTFTSPSQPSSQGSGRLSKVPMRPQER